MKVIELKTLLADLPKMADDWDVQFGSAELPTNLDITGIARCHYDKPKHKNFILIYHGNLNKKK